MYTSWIQCKDGVISSLFYLYHLANITFSSFVGNGWHFTSGKMLAYSSFLSLGFSLLSQCVLFFWLWRKKLILSSGSLSFIYVGKDAMVEASFHHSWVFFPRMADGREIISFSSFFVPSS